MRRESVLKVKGKMGRNRHLCRVLNKGKERFSLEGKRVLSMKINNFILA